MELIDRPPLALEVLPRLEHAIITRELPPGHKLAEDELCARYGISRSPLREALRLLETRGLVVRRLHYGVRVAPMTIEDLDNVYACRAPLEALASAGAAGAPDHADIAASLRPHLARMDATYRGGDVEACFEANVALTSLLHDAAKNVVLRRLLDQIDRPGLRYRHWAYHESPELLALSIASNGALIDAIAAGDAAMADAVTRKLVLSAWESVRSLFAKQRQS